MKLGMQHSAFARDTLPAKALRMHLPLVGVVTLLVAVGVVLLYAAANGAWAPYATAHMSRYGIGLLIVFCVALIDIKHLHRWAYWFYAFALALLVLVPVMGHAAMGATRWLTVGGVRLQPSELMKIALILALARYYHNRSLATINTLPGIVLPLVMIGLPALLTAMQPDLGTSVLLILMGAGVMFASGVSWKLYALGFMGGAAFMPVAWLFLLHDYQKNRILTFMDPGRDPLGAGYHILQSKIAIGSAGFWGKGYMEGSQSHLLFLPEKHTDFIFTLMSEDFGMVGALVVMGLYLALILIGVSIASRSRSQFGTAVALGVTLTVFIYAFINMAMVMGLMPVVGVPLPFISYGGTALLTLMTGIGLLMNVHVHRHTSLPGAAGITGD